MYSFLKKNLSAKVSEKQNLVYVNKLKNSLSLFTWKLNYHE